jgi:hypothetical protein
MYQILGAVAKELQRCAQVVPQNPQQHILFRLHRFRVTGYGFGKRLVNGFVETNNILYFVEVISALFQPKAKNTGA